jgi:arylformamidase
MRVLDVSSALSSFTPAYPGDPKVSVKCSRTADGALVSRLSMSAHSGTHVDAPAHYVPGGKTVAEVGLGRLIGRAKVCDLTDHEGPITPRSLQRFRIHSLDIVLLKTRNSRLMAEKKFTRDYVSLTQDAALYLASKKVNAVGIDYLSIDAYGCDAAHKILLKAGIPVIEGLDLSLARNGKYTLICLPLKLMGTEAAPARCVLLP